MYLSTLSMYLVNVHDDMSYRLHGIGHMVKSGRVKYCTGYRIFSYQSLAPLVAALITNNTPSSDFHY